MTPDLRERIAKAFLDGAATPPEQDQLNQAAAPVTVKAAENLDAQALRLLLDLETRGRR